MCRQSRRASRITSLLEAYSPAATAVRTASAISAVRVMVRPGQSRYAFIDGNKRTGFVVGILFLDLNGYTFTASEEDAAQAVLELTAGTLDQAGYTDFPRANSQPARSGNDPLQNR